MVREKLQELGQHIDHDLSGLVYTPLTHVEVHTITTSLECFRQRYAIARLPAMPGAAVGMHRTGIMTHHAVYAALDRSKSDCRQSDLAGYFRQVEDSAFEMNEAILERLLTVDDVDAIHTNCAGLTV